MKFKKGDKIVFVKEIGAVSIGDKFEITGKGINVGTGNTYAAVWKVRGGETPNSYCHLTIIETDRCAILSTLQLEFDM